MRLQKNQKGIAHHLLLAGVAVLVLGAVGFAGLKVYKSKNDINAKAAGWTTVKIISGNYTVTHNPPLAFNATTVAGKSYRLCANAYYKTGSQPSIDFFGNNFTLDTTTYYPVNYLTPKLVCSKAKTLTAGMSLFGFSAFGGSRTINATSFSLQVYNDF